MARRWLVLVGLAYLVFVVYGSLVPLRFHARELDEAWETFREIQYLRLGLASRADWVANILLFIPLAFVWTGVLDRGRFGLAPVAGAVVLVACGALSVAIEFTQLFFPPRTVSLNDIVAETLGAGIGTVVWWVRGRRLMRWLDGWSAARGPTSLARRLLYGYLFLLLGYNVLPLDLTLSPVEIYHKWREGRIGLVPFVSLHGEPVELLYEIGTDVLIWVPAGLLWQIARPRPLWPAWFRVFAGVVLLEFLQLFIYSRVADVTDLLTGGVGAVTGVLAARLVGRPTRARPMADQRVGPMRRTAVWLTLASLWVAVIAAVFWYPYEFQLSGSLLRDRVHGLAAVPLIAFYYSSEFRAVTELLRKAGFFLPLGVLMAGAVSQLASPQWRPPAAVAALLLIAGVAVGIEAAKLLLPNKSLDLANPLLEWLGASAGYVGWTWLGPRWVGRTPATDVQGGRPPDQHVGEHHVVSTHEETRG